MGRPKKQRPAEIIEDQAVKTDIVEAVIEAAPPMPREWQVGDRVTIKKDRAAAVVTRAGCAKGGKQLHIECQRCDNASVTSYWFDEIE